MRCRMMMDSDEGMPPGRHAALFPARAFPANTGSPTCSLSLFLRHSGRKTGSHFCWSCSRQSGIAGGPRRSAPPLQHRTTPSRIPKHGQKALGNRQQIHQPRSLRGQAAISNVSMGSSSLRQRMSPTADCRRRRFFSPASRRTCFRSRRR